MLHRLTYYNGYKLTLYLPQDIYFNIKSKLIISIEDFKIVVYNLLTPTIFIMHII